MTHNQIEPSFNSLYAVVSCDIEQNGFRQPAKVMIETDDYAKAKRYFNLVGPLYDICQLWERDDAGETSCYLQW